VAILNDPVAPVTWPASMLPATVSAGCALPMVQVSIRLAVPLMAPPLCPIVAVPWVWHDAASVEFVRFALNPQVPAMSSGAPRPGWAAPAKRTQRKVDGLEPLDRPVR
jgi:hypothetical protein